MSSPRSAAGLVAIVGFLVLTLVPVLTGYDQYSKKSYDMDTYHVPVVRAFAEQLPAVDLSDYNSATTPGMHLMLAVIAKVFGPSETIMQVATCVFGALLIFIAWWYASIVARPWIALVAVIPLALNPYTLGNAIWVMTDNLSLALIAITIGSSVFLRPRIKTLIGTSFALLGAILIRQINLWVIAGVWVIAIFSLPAIRDRLPWRDELDEGFSAARVFAISIGVLVSIGVLAIFIWLWGGLVPPSVQARHSRGINVAVTPFVLTLFAVYAAPMWLFLGQRMFANKRTVRAMGVGALVGLFFGALFESTIGLDVGRMGGWMWLLSGASPDVAGRSLFLVFGSLVGGGLLGALMGMLAEAGRGRAAFLLLLFGASFLTAYTVNSQAYQRYFDGPVLLFAGWSLVLAMRKNEDNDGQRVIFCGALMALMQLVFCSWTIYRPLFFGDG
jgi:hypothetical protein